MNIKKFILATIAGSLTMWLVAGLWHKVIMVQFYTAETHATHEGTGVILLAYFVLGVFMVFLYSRFYKSGRPDIEGLKFGLIIGLLWVFPHELAMAGAHETSIIYVIKNAAWHMVEQGIGGIVIGLIMGRMKAKPENE